MSEKGEYCSVSISGQTRQTRADLSPSYLAQVPTGTFAQPEEVAASVLYLCSDEAKNVNGTDLRLDGGFTTR